MDDIQAEKILVFNNKITIDDRYLIHIKKDAVIDNKEDEAIEEIRREK